MKDDKHIFKSRFVRDSGTLLLGSVVAQGVAFLAYLLLARLFTPDDFGLYSVFYSYIEVLIILSTCKYELSIVVAESDIEARNIAQGTLRLNAVVSGLMLAVAGVLALTGSQLSTLCAPLYLLIPFMVFFCGTTRVYIFLLNRHKQYRYIAVSEILTSLSGVAAKILFGVLNTVVALFHSLGLPLGTILGKMASNVYLHRMAKRCSAPANAQFSIAIFKKYKNFPLYVMPKEFVSSFSANMPLFLLAFWFDNALLGLYSLALTFTQRPVNILANVFEKVFYASCSEKVRDRQPIRHDIRRFLLVLNAVAIPLALLGFFFAEPVFTFLFGEKWIGTGYYVRCLIPWLLVVLSVNSLTFVANIFGTQRVDFILQLVQLVLRVVALLIGIVQADYRLAILLFCLASTAVQLCQLAWYLLQIFRYQKNITQ